MKKHLFKSLFLGLGVSIFCASDISAQKNVIMYIGDGFGVAPKTAARMALGQGTTGKKFSTDAGFQVLALDKLKYTGTATTHSQNSWITDSGPGASVYACGKSGKVDNEAVSYSVSGDSAVQTILERAKKDGYAVGIITTTRITHATPAAFASHIWFRDLEDYIASQYISTTQAEYEAIYNDPASKIKPYNAARDWALPRPKVGVEVDLMLGGGLRHFYPNNMKDTVRDAAGKPLLNGYIPILMTGKRKDSVNLINIAKQRGYTYINSRDALLKYDLSTVTPGSNAKLLGLFNASHMNYEQDRQTMASWEPSLFEMTEIAIEFLKRKGGTKGFFLMVEGGRIDHLGHANTGGISVISGDSATAKNKYSVDANKEVYVGGGDAASSATPTSSRQKNIYGSDYMIKEVLAFDYAVAQGRKLLTEKSKTLILSTSDHECGGVAVVGLHDDKDEQKNGTKIRTYALGPKQKGTDAASSGAATATTVAAPIGVTRGDVAFGATNPEGWFPEYTLTTFQDRPEQWPVHTPNGRRIVISYGSNPITNGNGAVVGGTPGNHTPQDVWIGLDDNDGGKWASKISGKGLLDNTDLHPIMVEFLKVPGTTFNEKEGKSETKLMVYPNPINSNPQLELLLEKNSSVLFQVYNVAGQLMNEPKQLNLVKGSNKLSWSDIKTAPLAAGVYHVTCIIDNTIKESRKIVVQ